MALTGGLFGQGLAYQPYLCRERIYLDYLKPQYLESFRQLNGSVYHRLDDGPFGSHVEANAFGDQLSLSNTTFEGVDGLTIVILLQAIHAFGKSERRVDSDYWRTMSFGKRHHIVVGGQLGDADQPAVFVENGAGGWLLLFRCKINPQEHFLCWSFVGFQMCALRVGLVSRLRRCSREWLFPGC